MSFCSGDHDKGNRTVINLGGSLTYLVCILLVVAILHYSCQSGSATGYVGDVCSRGLNIWDYIGIVCCAPLYLLIIILTSGGLRIW